MADVFVSYARGEEPLARTIAQHLNDSGFSVWWDSDLLPHNSFAQVIERELRAARAVLVVWSERAVDSQWVRAEADMARNQGKLIQVSIDACAIPLPFNQIQAASLMGWKGDADHPDWRKVVSSVAELTAHAATEPPLRPGRLRGFRSKAAEVRQRGGIRSALMLAAATVVLVAGGMLVLRSLDHAPLRGTRIAVLPFQAIGETPAVRDFAASLSGSLQDVLTQDQLQTVSSSEAETLTGAGASARAKALRVGLTFNGTVQAGGAAITTSMRLEDPASHATLWTAEISGPAAQGEQLKARVGALTVAVLSCSAQALKPKGGISDPAVLETFLHACDLAETSDHGESDQKVAYAMLNSMRRVAHDAPDFAAGHSVLAKHIAFLLPVLPEDQTASLRKEATAEAHRALAIDPRDPDGFVALGLLAPLLDFAQREHFFRLALDSDPAWPHANGFLGNVMTDLGRVQEAATLYARAASVNPQSQDWAQMAARGQIWTGQTREADAELARFAELWPDNPEVLEFQFQSMMAQRRWADAFAVLDRVNAVPGAESSGWVTYHRALVLALKSNDGAARDSLRRDYLSGRVTGPQGAMTGLGMLGFIDDAFSVAQNYSPTGPDGPADPEFLFGPETAPLRHDPRFMALADKFGLVRFWRATAHWPDFCSDPGLPYDCKAAAAKLGAGGPVAGPLA